MLKPFAVAFLAAVGGIQAQTLPGIWVGAFEGPELWGRLELTLEQKGDEWSAQARVEVNGRLHSEPVHVSIGEGTIGFRTIWEGREIRVTGTVVGTRLRGSVTIAETSPDRFVSARLDLVRLSMAASDILPPPTGSLAIGRSTFRWVDEKRAEPSAIDPSDKRELLVYLWYPTERRGHSPYLTDAERVAPFLPKGTAEIARALELAVSTDAPIIKGRRYPVVLFSPGKGVNAFHYSSLYEDLASHGFVVAAVDHPYDAPVAVFPEGRAVLPLPKEARPGRKGSDLEVQ